MLALRFLKNQDRTRGYLTQTPKIALFSMVVYKILITSKSQKQQVVQAPILKKRYRTTLMLQVFLLVYGTILKKRYRTGLMLQVFC